MEQGLVMADVLEARGLAAAVTQRKAAVLVCEHALDLADAGQLLDMLGLRPRSRWPDHHLSAPPLHRRTPPGSRAAFFFVP